MYNPVKVHQVNVDAVGSTPVPPYRLFTRENVAEVDAFLMHKFKDTETWAKLGINSKVIKDAFPVSDFERGILLSCYIDLRRTNWNFYRTGRGSNSYGVEPYEPKVGMISPRRWFVEDWRVVGRYLEETLEQKVVDNKFDELPLQITVNTLRDAGLPLETSFHNLHPMLACKLAFDEYDYEYVGMRSTKIKNGGHHPFHTYKIWGLL